MRSSFASAPTPCETATGSSPSCPRSSASTGRNEIFCGAEVPEHRDPDAADGQDRDQQRVVQRRQRHAAVVAEQEENPEDHEHVPLQRHRQRERREDVHVEEHHPDDRDRHSVPLGETSSSNGSVNSITVPRCAASAPVAEGSRSSGWSAPEPALDRARAVPRRVADHHRHDEREVPVQLRRRGAPPDADEHDLRADDQVPEREQEEDQQDSVDLRAGARGTGPCRAIRAARSRPAARPPRSGRAVRPRSRRPACAGDEQVDGRGEQARVQRDVEQRAPRAARQRHPLGPRRQARSSPGAASRGSRRSAARSETSAASTRRRGRAPPTASSRRRLLEHDRLRPPAGYVAEPAEAERRRGDHQRPPSA